MAHKKIIKNCSTVVTHVLDPSISEKPLYHRMNPQWLEAVQFD